MSNFSRLLAPWQGLGRATQAARCALVAVGAMWALAAPASAASTAPTIANLEDLKQAFASALAGSFPASQCSLLGSESDGEYWSGTLQIGADGQIVAPRGRVRLHMFDPRGSMGLTRRYPPYPPKMTNALFGYELKVAGEMFRIEPDKPVSEVFLETGFDGGIGNAQKGVLCPVVDMSNARIAAAGYDMNELMLPIFDTHGATLTGQCRAMGGRAKPRPADRSATLRVSAEGVRIDGQLLPFDDSRRRIVEHHLGSRFSDGTLNGSYEWIDGSMVHMERMVIGAGKLNAPFATFSFHLPDMPEGVSYFCRPGGLLPGGKS